MSSSVAHHLLQYLNKQQTTKKKKLKLAIQRSKKRIIETQSWVFEAHPLPLKTETA
jgi:hypothetical protein